MTSRILSEYTLIERRRVSSGDEKIKLHWQPSWLLRVFGARPGEYNYVGQCTFWREYPTGEFVGLSLTSTIMRLVAADRMRAM